MTTLKPARQELLAFAAASLSEEWAARLSKALDAATTAGWPPLRSEAYACQLIFREGDPAELAAAARQDQELANLGRDTVGDKPASPAAIQAIAADARASIAGAKPKGEQAENVTHFTDRGRAAVCGQQEPSSATTDLALVTCRNCQVAPAFQVAASRAIRQRRETGDAA